MTSDRGLLNEKFIQLKCCVIIPTYNNEKTLSLVIQDTLIYTDKIIVVNDGATDGTNEILKTFGQNITIVQHAQNLGKGMALRNGFKKALELGYEYAISIDSDGQHFPGDLDLFLEELKTHDEAIIIGARNMKSENVPGGSSFGNKFSNFWFQFITGIKLPDTQSGYRLYPIKKLSKIKFYTNRFEFEIEVLVKAAWKGLPVLSIPVQIFYAKGKERISHFRPTQDFARISFLNVYFVLLAVAWYKPMRFFKGLTPANIKSFVKKHFFNEKESITKTSLSVTLGIFFGIVPIWGYQLISAIAFAYLLKLNRAIVILAANISLPPLIPFILVASVEAGELITGEDAKLSVSDISFETIKTNLYTYLTGACLLAVCFAVFMGVLTFLTLTFLRRKRTKSPRI